MSLRSLARAALISAALATPALGQSPTAAAKSAAPAAPVMADSLAHARRLTQWFFTSQIDSLYAWVPEADRPKVTKEVLTQQVLQFAGRFGNETEVLEEKFVKRNGMTQYWRSAKFSLMSEPVMFRWALTPQGQIAGIGVNPANQPPPIDP